MPSEVFKALFSYILRGYYISCYILYIPYDHTLEFRYGIAVVQIASKLLQC